MLNQRAQIMLDDKTKDLIQYAANTMSVSFSEAVRQAAQYSYQTKKIHKNKPKKSTNPRLAAYNNIVKIRKSLKPSNLTIEDIKAMAHYGHKY